MTEIILFLFAFIYYIFSVFASITYVQENKKYTVWSSFCISISVMIIAPIAVPVFFGIIVGEYFKNKCNEEK